MKRFLFPFLASVVLPTAVNAESYWLILRYGSEHKTGIALGGAALEKIEMESMAQCELMGAKWTGSKLFANEEPRRTILAFECLEGK